MQNLRSQISDFKIPRTTRFAQSPVCDISDTYTRRSEICNLKSAMGEALSRIEQSLQLVYRLFEFLGAAKITGDLHYIASL